MVQILDKYGNTSTDEGRVLILDKYGAIKRVSGGGGGSPTGPAGGDLSGTYPNPSVVWANGYSVYNSTYYPLSSNPAGYLTSASLTGYVPYTGATTNVDLGEYQLKAGQIELDQTPTGTFGVAKTRWNDTDGVPETLLKGGNVTLQHGLETLARVVNKSGVNLLEANYQVVRIRLVSEGGAAGQRLAVVLAQGDNDTDSVTTLGVVTETINNNQEGFITILGEIHEINTTGSLQGETWVDGDILYLSSTVAGQLTNIRPVAPDHAVFIGYVVYAHAIHGKIFVNVQNGYELGELHDVYVPSPSDKNILYWNNTNSRYEVDSIVNVLGYTPQNSVLNAYSVMANNTNASAAGVAQTFKSIANQTYTGTPVWTGTTAPSGVTTHSYSWNQIGNLVTLRINLVYATGGSALTAVTIPLPTDCPAPYVASGGTPSTNRVIAVGSGIMQTNFSVSTVTTYVLLKTNSTNTGFDIIAQRASANYQMVTVTVTYLTT